MTDRQAMEPFETQLAGRVRTYTDVAAGRQIDALGVARSAMASQRAGRWSVGWLGGGSLGRRIGGDRWAVALMAVVLIGVVSIAILGRRSDSNFGSQPTPSASTGGAIPDVLRHSWQRPTIFLPGQPSYPTAFLSLVSAQLEFGREPGSGASRTSITAADVDIVVVTATVETVGCAVGDIGIYRWIVEGKGTVLTLTAIGTDACAAREEALAGPWVRSDLPPPIDESAPLQPGTYLTSSFNPFGDATGSGQLSYTVPEGWKVKDDEPGFFLLHHLPDVPQNQPSFDALVMLLARPAIAADFANGAPCDSPVGDAPRAGRGLDELVAGIRARPGVVSRTPVAVTIGGYQGQMLDLALAPSWTGACVTPDGPVVGMPLIHEAGAETGPGLGLGPDHPLRLFLLDLTGGRTVAIAVFEVEQSQPSEFEAHTVAVMPVIESFEFHSPAP